MTVIPFQRRQPKGRPTGGQFAATAHAEATVSLAPPSGPTRPEVPEKLRMAYIPKENQLGNLASWVEKGVESGDPRFAATLFAEELPNLSAEDAQRRFYEAKRLADKGMPYHRVLAQAVDADLEAAPGGTIQNGYTPPGVFADENGYTRGATVGEKHVGYRNAADIAKDIRAELKAAVAGNYLPQGLTFSVRSSKFAGGQSIDVEIQGLPDEDRLDPVEKDHYGDPAWRPEANELQERVESIVNAFNKNDSDGSIDYFSCSFYGRVSVETDSWREFREQEIAKRKARAAG